PGERATLGRILPPTRVRRRGPRDGDPLDAALPAGGVVADGKPGFRAVLPGDGEREVWFHLDGEPAGCRYRDPLRRALVELYRDGAGARIVTDGELSADWRLAPPERSAPPAARFERPARCRRPPPVSPP